MARTKKGTPPSYPSRPHCSGQARITVRLANGKRRDLTLGAHGSPESRAEYRRVLAELEAHGGLYPVGPDGAPAAPLTVAELVALFEAHAEKHYRLIDGTPSREVQHFRLALAPLIDLYGAVPAADFGPRAFLAVREALVQRVKCLVRLNEGGRDATLWLPAERVRREPVRVERGGGWVGAEVVRTRKALCRRVINQRMEHVKRLFAWAVGAERVPPAVHEALLRVPDLRRGHQGTRDAPKVKPVPDEVVTATLPFLLPQVAAMVELQRLTGARPSEVCLMRGAQVRDRDRPVWRYVIDPGELAGEGGLAGAGGLHKTAHREEADGSPTVKVLPVGPRAQEILKPWLRDDPHAYLFQPGEAKAAQAEAQRGGRKTPLYPSHVRHQAGKKKAAPRRPPRDHYDRHSYARAVARAAKKAGVAHWHPHQLKHVCGTRVRQEFGVEASQSYLGHQKMAVTEIYAEKNWKLVEKIALEMG